MNKNVIVYLDNKGNEVPAKEATRINIIEYDENGKMVNETFMVAAKPKKPEEIKRTYTEEELWIDKDIITNIEWNLPKKSRIEEILERQKTK